MYYQSGITERVDLCYEELTGIHTLDMFTSPATEHTSVRCKYELEHKRIKGGGTGHVTTQTRSLHCASKSYETHLGKSHPPTGMQPRLQNM